MKGFETLQTSISVLCYTIENKGRQGRIMPAPSPFARAKTINETRSYVNEQTCDPCRNNSPPSESLSKTRQMNSPPIVISSLSINLFTTSSSVLAGSKQTEISAGIDTVRTSDDQARRKLFYKHGVVGAMLLL